MIQDERHLKIPGVVDRIPVVCAFVADSARRTGMEERAVHHCQLAADEAFTNVAEHAFGLEGEKRDVEVVCRCEDGRFSITVSDDGPAFNPLTHVDPDPTTPLEEREPGGWGIFFIKKMMDEVIYERDNGQNSLTMVKQVAAGKSDKPPRMVAATALGGDVWTVAPYGRLDSQLSPTVEAVIADKLADGERFVVDLSRVDYVSSTGLKTLVRLLQRARKKHGDVVLAGLHPRVREVLQIVGLDGVFRVYDSADAAFAALTSR